MIPFNASAAYRKLVIEKMLIGRAFPFLHCRIRGIRLTCRGNVRPSESSPAYRVEFEYSAGNRPEVRVINPVIEYTPGVHMYRNGTLCLYDWREQPWQANWHLFDTVIPWSAEWLVFYELWLLTGKWKGRSAPHGIFPQQEG